MIRVAAAQENSSLAGLAVWPHQHPSLPFRTAGMSPVSNSLANVCALIFKASRLADGTFPIQILGVMSTEFLYGKKHPLQWKGDRKQNQKSKQQ